MELREMEYDISTHMDLILTSCEKDGTVLGKFDPKSNDTFPDSVAVEGVDLVYVFKNMVKNIKLLLAKIASLIKTVINSLRASAIRSDADTKYTMRALSKFYKKEVSTKAKDYFRNNLATIISAYIISTKGLGNYGHGRYITIGDLNNALNEFKVPKIKEDPRSRGYIIVGATGNTLKLVSWLTNEDDELDGVEHITIDTEHTRYLDEDILLLKDIEVYGRETIKKKLGEIDDYVDSVAKSFIRLDVADLEKVKLNRQRKLLSAIIMANTKTVGVIFKTNLVMNIMARKVAER